MNNFIKIIIIVLIEIFITSIIINYDFYKRIIKRINHKIIRSILKIFQMVLIVLLFIWLLITFEDFKEGKELKEKNNLNIKEVSTKIEEEYTYYEKSIKNYVVQYKEPYIPNGFNYVEGNYENGFVIEDENKNQYVWVPCSNKEYLKKNNFCSNPFISYYECYDERYKEFINSIIENEGFYISRFQIGKENNIPVSKKNTEIWNITTLDEAKDIVNSMYKQPQFFCEIINGFAYDITLNWIFNNNKINFDEEEFEKNLYTGKKSYKNIYDILDENFEITLEKSYSETQIYRGFKKTEEDFGIDKKNNRWLFIEQNDVIENLGIRIILYY